MLFMVSLYAKALDRVNASGCSGSLDSRPADLQMRLQTIEKSVSSIYLTRTHETE